MIKKLRRTTNTQSGYKNKIYAKIYVKEIKSIKSLFCYAILKKFETKDLFASLPMHSMQMIKQQ